MIGGEYFSFYWQNPLKTYNKIKKYYKSVKPKFYWSCKYQGKYCAKILDIDGFDLAWKDKWNSPRHEFDPRITICLFRRLYLRITLTASDDSLEDMCYWESALYWLYYKKSLRKAVKAVNGWSQLNKEGEYENIKINPLKEPYRSAYDNNTLENIYYEGNIKD